MVPLEARLTGFKGAFFSLPLFARSLKARLRHSLPPTEEEKIFKKKEKKKERIHSMNFRSDSSSTQRARFLSFVLRGTRLRGARFSRFRTRRILTGDRFLPWPRDKRGGGENKFVTEEPTRVCQNKEKRRKEKEEGRVRHEYSTGTKFLTYPTVY